MSSLSLYGKYLLQNRYLNGLEKNASIGSTLWSWYEKTRKFLDHNYTTRAETEYIKKVLQRRASNRREARILGSLGILGALGGLGVAGAKILKRKKMQSVSHMKDVKNWILPAIGAAGLTAGAGALANHIALRNWKKQNGIKNAEDLYKEAFNIKAIPDAIRNFRRKISNVGPSVTNYFGKILRIPTDIADMVRSTKETTNTVNNEVRKATKHLNTKIGLGILGSALATISGIGAREAIKQYGKYKREQQLIRGAKQIALPIGIGLGSIGVYGLLSNKKRDSKKFR